MSLTTSKSKNIFTSFWQIQPQALRNIAYRWWIRGEITTSKQLKDKGQHLAVQSFHHTLTLHVSGWFPANVNLLHNMRDMKAKTWAVTGVSAAPIINNSSGKTIIWIWSKQVLIVSSHQQQLIWRKALLRPYGYGFIMSLIGFQLIAAYLEQWR